MKQELLLGCGTNRKKCLLFKGDLENFENLITLDINPDRNPDVVWDLTNRPLPFEDCIFDEIHCYHVLEHFGAQGDAKEFFSFFEEMSRILKPQGRFHCIVPYWKGDWIFGDPGHTRVIHPNAIQFLDQGFYKGCEETAATDYRYMYKANFKLLQGLYNNKEDSSGYFGFILEKQ